MLAPPCQLTLSRSSTGKRVVSILSLTKEVVQVLDPWTLIEFL